MLSTDDDGTIWCAVPPFARFSYFGEPDKTAAAWRDTPDGPAFTVGDLGRLDEDGYLFLDGRREDLVISGGVNVYPLEVEQVAPRASGASTTSRCTASPDDDWGQRVCAAYVGSATADELDAFVRERLAPPKRPKTWHPLARPARARSPGRCGAESCPGELGAAEGRQSSRVDGQSAARSSSGKRRWTAS